MFWLSAQMDLSLDQQGKLRDGDFYVWPRPLTQTKHTLTPTRSTAITAHIPHLIACSLFGGHSHPALYFLITSSSPHIMTTGYFPKGKQRKTTVIPTRQPFTLAFARTETDTLCYFQVPARKQRGDSLPGQGSSTPVITRGRKQRGRSRGPPLAHSQILLTPVFTRSVRESRTKRGLHGAGNSNRLLRNTRSSD